MPRAQQPHRAILSQHRRMSGEVRHHPRDPSGYPAGEHHGLQGFPCSFEPDEHITNRLPLQSCLCGGPDVHLPQRHFAQLEPGHAAGGLLGLRTLCSSDVVDANRRRRNSQADQSRKSQRVQHLQMQKDSRQGAGGELSGPGIERRRLRGLDGHHALHGHGLGLLRQPHDHHQSQRLQEHSNSGWSGPCELSNHYHPVRSLQRIEAGDLVVVGRQLGIEFDPGRHVVSNQGSRGVGLGQWSGARNPGGLLRQDPHAPVRDPLRPELYHAAERPL
mmetsp:Transcript_16702/g.28422  ORF Transcript_16702/g.28422 Transcript_16702/m.28422 type:complete len:274 (+) Transcript_16702:540-1361(+)